MTSDERREVAERLRKARGIKAFVDALGIDLDGDWYWTDVSRRVADLIDPTCRNISDDHSRNFRCSECGCFWPNFFLDGHNCCPSCGARLVDE